MLTFSRDSSEEPVMDYPPLEEPPKAASGSVINRLFELEQTTQQQAALIEQLQADIGKICEIVGVKL